jgi:hypothetical protein
MRKIPRRFCSARSFFAAVALDKPFARAAFDPDRVDVIARFPREWPAILSERGISDGPDAMEGWRVIRSESPV